MMASVSPTRLAHAFVLLLLCCCCCAYYAHRDAFVAAGFPALGYEYFNLDDCWAKGRASDGTILADPAVFPSGIESFAAYVHGKGLKFGVYTDRGPKTCGGRPGAGGHVAQPVELWPRNTS